VTYPVEYEVIGYGEQLDRMLITYSLPDGSLTSIEAERSWKSPLLHFTHGRGIVLRANGIGGKNLLVECHVHTRTEDDPDWTVCGGGGGRRCSISETAGENPFASD
jgi:hypothetical protein